MEWKSVFPLAKDTKNGSVSSLSTRQQADKDEVRIMNRKKKAIQYRSAIPTDAEQINHADTVGKLEEVREDRLAQKCKNTGEFSNFIVESLMWQRALTWGVPIPMTKLQRSIHNLVRRACRVEELEDSDKRRGFISFGTRVLPNSTAVCIVMTEPALSSSTVKLNLMSIDKARAEAGRVQVKSSSSSKNDRCTVSGRFGPCVAGRFAAHNAGTVESRSTGLSKVEFVNMASSVLYVCVYKPLKYEAILIPGPDTLPKLSQAMPRMFCADKSLEAIRLYLHVSQSTKGSHLKIGANGTIKACGGINDVGRLFENLTELMIGVLDSDIATTDFVESCSCLKFTEFAP